MKDVWVLEALVNYEPGYIVKVAACQDTVGFTPMPAVEIGDREERSVETWFACSEMWIRDASHVIADDDWPPMVARLGAGDPQDVNALRWSRWPVDSAQAHRRYARKAVQRSRCRR